MALFKGSHQETFVVDLPLGKAKEHFSSLDNIIASYGNLDRGEKVDEKTIHFKLEPKSAMGATFVGDYSVEYSFSSDNVFEWHSVGSGNMEAKGGIDFRSLGEHRTELSYRQNMTVDMPVNRLLAKALSPIVSKNISGGIVEFLDRMKRSARG
jgi:uncharacterized membrane protein